MIGYLVYAHGGDTGITFVPVIVPNRGVTLSLFQFFRFCLFQVIHCLDVQMAHFQFKILINESYSSNNISFSLEIISFDLHGSYFFYVPYKAN